MNLSALKEELDRGSVVCPHCKSRYRWIDGKWSTAIKRHGPFCNCPENWFCAICNELIETVEDFKEYEKNGVHVACGEKEMAEPFRCETHEWVRLNSNPHFSGYCDRCGVEMGVDWGREDTICRRCGAEHRDGVTNICCM